MLETAALELTEAAASTGTPAERAQAVLDVVVRNVPCDAAWLATVEPGGQCASRASTDPTRCTLAHLAGTTTARGVEPVQPHRPHPARSARSATELPVWAERLLPAGFQEALAVALVGHDRRHVGVLALLSGSRRPPAAGARRALHHLAPLVARAVDPLRPVALAAELLGGASAGAVLYRRGSNGELPGLDGDALLVDGSPLLAVARACLEGRRPLSAFLWPRGGRHAPDGHTRVTVLASRPETSSPVLGAVVLAPAGGCRGLTPRELEVVGLVVEGCSNAQIAQRLVLAPRTVATHLEHVLCKLDAPTRTAAAVRADREGLYVPWW